MTAKSPIEGSFYITAHPVKGGAEIEVEDSDQRRLERIADNLERKNWTRREGLQPSLFSDSVTVRFFQKGKAAIRNMNQVINGVHTLV